MRVHVSAPDVVPSPLELFRRSADPHADRSIRQGRWVVVTRGVYADAGAWHALAPWDRYLARVHAAAARHPDAIFVRESAAALRGLPVFGEPRDVHVVAGPAATARVVSGTRVHIAERLPEHEELGGLLVAAPLEIAVDLARHHHHAVGLACACSVLRHHHDVDVAAMRSLNLARRSSRGRRHAAWVFDRATGVPESTLEVVSLAVIEWLGFPVPELQQRFNGETVEDDLRLDYWWQAARIGGEADGDAKYAGMDAATMLRARRVRDARLLERGVAATVHWGWYEATHVAPLRAALIAAG
jgi:hypothetical protein